MVKMMIYNVNILTIYKGSFGFKKEWASSKSVFWKGNDSLVKLMLSVKSGIFCDIGLVIKIC